MRRITTDSTSFCSSTHKVLRRRRFANQGVANEIKQVWTCVDCGIDAGQCYVNLNLVALKEAKNPQEIGAVLSICDTSTHVLFDSTDEAA